ncbi:MAG: DNA-3-methyladenine glycosylase family protein [Gemmatimonadales bacterium]
MNAPPQRLGRADLSLAVRALAERDPELGALVRAHGEPPLWGRRGGFATLVKIILEQQVSLASARTLFARLERGLGAVTPEAVLRQGSTGLRALGLTRQKAVSVGDLAAHVARGELPIARLGRLSDEAARASLLRVRGIGPWTADIYLLMALRRPDVWPQGDLALHRMLQVIDPGGRLPTALEAMERSARWAPWRAVAARILWHSYLSARAA